MTEGIKDPPKSLKKSFDEVHRRAQKAEGAVAAVRFVLDGWDKVLSDGRLPDHDFLVKSIKRELDAALSRHIQ